MPLNGQFFDDCDGFLYARLKNGRIMLWRRPSVRLSVRLSVRPSVCHTLGVTPHNS